MTNTITVDGQELRLVRLTTNTYPVTPSGTDWSGEDLVFYAKDLDSTRECVRLVAPTSDPRTAAGFYRISSDPVGHVGWNIERQYAVDIPEFAPGDRVRIVEVGSGLRPEWHGREVTYVGPSDPGRTSHPHAVAFDATDTDTSELLMDDDGRRMGYVSRIEHVDTPPAVQTFTQEDVDRLVSEAVRDARRTASIERQRWVDSLVSDAHDYANSNNLCGEFDRFMEAHDLPGRTREYEVTFDVSGTATVTVTASSRDEAVEAAEDEVRSSIDGIDVDEYRLYDVSVA